MSTKIVSQFPLLVSQKAQGPFAYFDNAATTQKPESVIRSIDNFYRGAVSNVHRGVYPLAEKATALFENARETVADFFNLPSTKNVIFTGGATAGLNLLAQAFEDFIVSGDVIVLSELEHHSNIMPWQKLAKRKKAMIKWVPIKKNGDLDLLQYRDILEQGRVKIVALTALSHVLGNQVPTTQMFETARAFGAITVLDATQSILRMRHDWSDLNCDALVFSGHKVLGPSGIGAVCLSQNLQKKLSPPFVGGGMADEVSRTDFTWQKGPWGFESGTPPIEGAIGLATALRFVEELNFQETENEELKLIDELALFLRAIPQVELVGWASVADLSQAPLHSGILSFKVRGLHEHDVAQVLAESGVAVRAGQHCAQILMRSMNVTGLVRVSLAPYNSSDEVELFKHTFREVLKVCERLEAAACL